MVIEDDVAAMHLRAPLLGSEASKAEAPRWKVEGSKHDEVGEQLGGGRAGLDVLFARRLLRLLSACRAWPAASFILLALAESLLTSEGGRVVSGFVRTLVDNDMRAFGVQVRNAAAVYLATTVLHSFTKFLAGMLALSWRRRLTLKLHAQYCKYQSWYRVVGVDNPDQRIARDVAAWSEQLAKVLQEVAVVPFEVLLYTHLTLQVLGWWVPVAAAYGFFTAGVLVQRAIAAPIARLVFRQRQSEGAFRAAHMRLRFLREEVAFYGGSCAERHHLGEVLRDVLAKQAAVVRRSWLQDAVTKALDYQGSILNYVCIALAVWSGRVKAASDAGEMASIISKSSFYMLGLIYAFTRVINTADTVASLAGLTARVAQLQEQLEAQEGASSGGRPAIGCQTHARAEASASQDMTLAMNAVRAAAPPPGAGAGAASDGAAADGQSSGARSAGAAAAAAAKQPGMGSSELQILARGGERGRYAPDLGRHHEKHAAQATMLISPVAITLPNQEAMEVSVHSMGSGLLLEEVMAVFPTCPCSGSIVAVVTFQSAPPGVELDATSEDMCQKAGTYMDRMLEEFLWFEGAVRALLEVEGFWCNAVDPRTGRALHGPRGSRYSEVVGAEVLLGYPQDMCGPCPVVLHPRFGKSAYPATLFTNAPLPMLLRCFLTCNASPSGVLGADAESSSGRSDVGCSEASCSEPSEPAACGEDEGPEADDCSLGQQPTAGPPPPPPADLCYPVDALLGGRGGVAGSGAPMASVLSTMALAGRAQHCVSYSGDGGVGFAASLGLPQGTQLWTVSSMPLTGTNSLPVRGPLPTPTGRPGRPAALGVASEPLLEVCGLALALPHAMVVVRNCSFSVAVGDNIQVSGPSGSGKTSLLRCLAGLQPPSSGTVKFGLHAKVMFVPQRPILAPGATLRHQLLYPDCLAPAAAPPDSSSAPDGYLQTLLHRVELPHLLQHTGGSFSACCDWTALSPGELQRLAFARVLHRQPTLVVMDEPTSALPPQQASRMLSLLTDAGISFLIASHDAHVEGATRFIQLFGDGSGSWSLV